MRGRTKRMKTSSDLSRKTADQTISRGSGMSSLQPGTSASARIMGSTSDEDEAGDDRQQRQDLGERDTDQHRGLQRRAQLGLTGLCLSGLSGQDADTKARADGSEAVADGADVAGQLREDRGLPGRSEEHTS